MKINSEHGIPEGQPVGSVSGSGAARGTQRAGKPAQEDVSSRLSTDATKLSELSAEIGKLPDIRQDRVQALRLQLLQGNHQVSNSDLANAVLNDQLPAKQ